MPKTLLQCFWCDCTTEDESLVKVDRATGRLVCSDCSEANR